MPTEIAGDIVKVGPTVASLVVTQSIHSEQLARMADEILARGVYVRAFSYPVVPKVKARIRTQMSATLTRDDLMAAADAFTAAREVVEG